MHTPLRITFQNTPSSAAIRKLIEEQVDHLEQFFGRMTAGLDERFADPLFAVTDAFRRARRRLQDRAKVMRHEVKALHKRIDRTLDQPD